MTDSYSSISKKSKTFPIEGIIWLTHIIWRLKIDIFCQNVQGKEQKLKWKVGAQKYYSINQSFNLKSGLGSQSLNFVSKYVVLDNH